MKIELTEKEFEMLKMLIHNTNECASRCIIEEYQEDNEINCENCDFYERKWNLIEKIESIS